MRFLCSGSGGGAWRALRKKSDNRKEEEELSVEDREAVTGSGGHNVMLTAETEPWKEKWSTPRRR